MSLFSRGPECPQGGPAAAEHRRVVADLNQEVHQKHQPSQTDLARHPSMHRTDTLDCLTCVRGEIFLITDNEEGLMRPVDTVIIRRTTHARRNRSTAPCLLVGTSTDPTPQDS